MKAKKDEDREFFKGQIMRLSGLDFFSQFPEGVRELVDTLIKHSKSQRHAKAVIDAWLADNNERPTPQDLKRLCKSTPADGDVQLPPGCSRCFGTDYIIVERRGATAAARCSCPRGRRLAELDEARAAGDRERLPSSAQMRRAGELFDGKARGAGGEE